MKARQEVSKATADRAQTPYQRVLAAAQVSEAEKERLRAKYKTLNPAALKRKLMRLQERLMESTASKKAVRVRPRQCNNDRYFSKHLSAKRMSFLRSTGWAAKRAERLALPIRILTDDGARVALQRCPILLAGASDSSTEQQTRRKLPLFLRSHFEWVFS